MASVNRIVVLSDTLTATGIAKNVGTELYQTDFVAVLKVSSVDVGTFDLKIEHSADGTNFEDLAVFAQLAGAGYETIQITDHVLPVVRANYILAGGASSVVMEAHLYNDKKK